MEQVIRKKIITGSKLEWLVAQIAAVTAKHCRTREEAPHEQFYREVLLQVLEHPRATPVLEASTRRIEGNTKRITQATGPTEVPLN